MNNGRHVNKSAPGKKSRKILSVAITVLLLTAVVGGTVAWLTDKSEPIVNTFESTDVTCYVEETFDGSEKTAVKIQNTGKIDAYIRVALVDNYVRSDGHICPVHVGSVPKVDGDNWELRGDGFYYYTKAVAPGGYTDVLFNNTIELKSNEGCCVEQLEILASAIQSNATWGQE